MKCPKCGAELDDYSRSCNVCGLRITADVLRGKAYQGNRNPNAMRNAPAGVSNQYSSGQQNYSNPQTSRSKKGMVLPVVIGLIGFLIISGAVGVAISIVISRPNSTANGIESVNSIKTKAVSNNISFPDTQSQVNNNTGNNISFAETQSQFNNNTGNTSVVTINNQVLCDSNGVKITSTGLKDSWMGTDLELLIENNSSKGVTVQARKASVNGFMVGTSMSANVAKGKKANDGLTFLTKGLKESGIEKIAVIEVSFLVLDTDTLDTIFQTDIIRINTSIAENYSQKYDDSGTVLVNSNGVKIISKGLSSDDSFWGPSLLLYIENSSNKDITVQVRDVSINGYMSTSIMSEDVVAGKKSICGVQFLKSDLDKNGISKVKDVELYFSVFEEQTWDDIFNSDIVKIAF